VARTRLIVRKGDENIALKVEDVVFIYRDNTLVMAVDNEQKKYLCNKNLMQLENELDEKLFFRVNRKYLVNINYIKGYKTFEKVKLLLMLTCHIPHHQIIISQETAPLFRKWISEDL
jgi:DNA-binding LytR/AlgR family response regulator